MARVVLYFLLLVLPGCQSLALSVLGAGAGSALRYSLDGIMYRTYTAPGATVKESTLAALERMGVIVDGTEPYEHGEIIQARTPNRTIEIEVEPISERATRVRIAAKNGSSWFYDSATATEIAAQTERLLEVAARGGTAPAGAIASPASPAIVPASTTLVPASPTIIPASAITPVVAPAAAGATVSAN